VPLTAPYKLSNLHYITLHYMSVRQFVRSSVTKLVNVIFCKQMNRNGTSGLCSKQIKRPTSMVKSSKLRSIPGSLRVVHGSQFHDPTRPAGRPDPRTTLGSLGQTVNRITHDPILLQIGEVIHGQRDQTINFTNKALLLKPVTFFRPKIYVKISRLKTF